MLVGKIKPLGTINGPVRLSPGVAGKGIDNNLRDWELTNTRKVTLIGETSIDANKASTKSEDWLTQLFQYLSGLFK